MSLNWIDLFIFAVICISALISLARGFIKEALSLLSWLIASVVAWLYGGSFSHHLTPYIENSSLRIISACLILFLCTLMVGAIVNFLIARLVQVTGMSGTDRFLGLFFGAARGGILITLAVGLLSLSPIAEDPAWRGSSLIPHFLLVADWSKNTILGLVS